MTNPGKLTFFSGKMGSGKSTLSKKIALDTGAIWLSEDKWLSVIYPEEIQTLKDYLKCSLNLKSILKEHLREVLLRGTSVVLDFPANTYEQRAWFKEIMNESNIPHELIFLDVPDSMCLQNIKKRNKSEPSRARFDTEEVFWEVSKYFIPPTADEGFKITIIQD